LNLERGRRSFGAARLPGIPIRRDAVIGKLAVSISMLANSSMVHAGMPAPASGGAAPTASSNWAAR